MQGWVKTTLGGAGLVGTYAGGAYTGAYARGKLERQMADQIERDLWTLGAENRLSDERPILPLRHRRQWHGVLCYAVGILGTGFVAWLVTVVITAAVVAAWDAPDAHPSEQFTVPLFAGFVIGVLAFVPGILVGALLWVREVRARIREAVAVPYREYWAERQRGAAALQAEQATPYQVGQVLASHIPEITDPDALLVDEE